MRFAPLQTQLNVSLIQIDILQPNMQQLILPHPCVAERIEHGEPVPGWIKRASLPPGSMRLFRFNPLHE
ncbi:hypothetical protein SOASR015_25110 [Pectobacterium carotovorum subsp. carotovorum]|nr:hypothetical protein SOASR015_25110 [Pectobacterium carotovorum subsp. carotovorum]GLX55323.1 hypothetical protein Pcaca02_06320 [Pectobacterium carotovorum subsp. carotovorum]